MAWGKIVRGIGLLVAVATALAGVLLIAPQFSPIPVPPERFAVVGGFLIYLAVVIVWNGVIRGLDTKWVLLDVLFYALVGFLPAAAAGAVALFVSIEAVSTRHWNETLFALPAVFAWWAAWVCFYRTGDGNAEEDDGSTEPEPEPEPEMTPDAGCRPTFGESIGAIVTGPLSIAPIAYFFALLPLGVALFVIVSRIVLHNALIPPAALPAQFWAELVTVLPKFEALGWLVAAFGVALAFGPLLALILPLGFGRDVNRLLTPDEMAFVLRAKAEVAAYGEKNGWVGLKRPSITLAVIPGSLIAVLLAAAAALYHYAPLLLPPPQGLNLYLPPFDSEPFVIGFMIFAFFCLTTPLSSVIAGRFSKRFAERDGWLAMSASDTLYGVETRLLIWLRRRRIGPDRPFDPGLFLRQAAHHWAPYWLAFLALFASALLYAGIHDQMAVLATGQGITVPGRWTFATRQYGYRDVVEVGLYCADERGHDFNFGYVVYFRDGSDVSFTTRRTLNHHLDAVVALDENLRRHNAFFNINFDFYETGCVKKLAKYEGGNSPERIERLFHLKEARAQDAP